jgi:diguanylate cyclase (GGDEF)-like protein/PAS domain S-box-containing protein
LRPKSHLLADDMKTSLSATTRITLSLVAIVLTILLSANLLGLMPSDREAILRGRESVCESIAIQCSVLASRGDLDAIDTCFQATTSCNPDIQSMGLRRTDGSLVMATAKHDQIWSQERSTASLSTHMAVPIYQGTERWGTAEVSYSPPGHTSWVGQYVHPLLAFCVFCVPGTLVLFEYYLRWGLTMLDPSRVVPQRVRTALDTLSEGLLFLDPQGRIVMANQSFASTVGNSVEQLIGTSATSLPWTERKEIASSPKDNSASTRDSHAACADVLADGQSRQGSFLSLQAEGNSNQNFSVSASPICDEAGRQSGAIASFEDVTRLEQKKNELANALQSLRLSSEKVREQNAILEHLATRDPLTNCYNRRSFFEQFDIQWNSAQRCGCPLSAVMVDIDHFKLVNDNHGHSVGDTVLQKVADTLQRVVGDRGIVARYGGEEFTLLLPNIDLADASALSETIRTEIEAIKLSQLSVTASLGVSSLSQSPVSPQDLLDQADRCLYFAKRNGRNQVARYDQIHGDSSLSADRVSSRQAESMSPKKLIPYPAVTALISALGYRDPSTAAHSRRVADLCNEVAHGLMSMSDRYVLETAALLHDIGKIGVPDSILLTSSQLTQAERNVIKRQERIGLEIIRASFASDELSRIVENYRRYFDGRDANLGPEGTHIPLGARILAVADAYDSMVSEHPYRVAKTSQEAIAELRRCANTQFDPEIVDLFSRIVGCQESEVFSSGGITKETALGIGHEIERLAEAIDQQDVEELRVMAGRLSESAAHRGAPEIAAKAIELEQAASSDDDVLGILQRACELIEYCRATQSSSIELAVSGQP